MVQSGIYGIFNRATCQWYVGKSVDLHQRRKEHFSNLRCGKHFNEHLQRSFGKYGEEWFDFIPLEDCQREALDYREQHWVAAKSSDVKAFGFNKTEGGTSNGRHGTKHSDEAKRKMSESQKRWMNTPDGKKRMSEAQLGKAMPQEVKDRIRSTILKTIRVWTPEGRERIRASRLGKVMSDETKLKVSLAKKGSRPWNKGMPASDELRKSISEGIARARLARSVSNVC